MTAVWTEPGSGRPSLGRQGIPGARSPFPLAAQVPAMLADDPMIVAFLDALDEVWAPIVSTLDCFDAYLDPRTAPSDMVAYLGSWILALVEDAQNEQQLREDVATAYATATASGTARVLHQRLVPRETDRVEVIDPGGTHTSTQPTDPQQWSDPEDPTVVIRLTPRRGASPRERERLTRLVQDLVPAHVITELRLA